MDKQEREASWAAVIDSLAIGHPISINPVDGSRDRQEGLIELAKDAYALGIIDLPELERRLSELLSTGA